MIWIVGGCAHTSSIRVESEEPQVDVTASDARASEAPPARPVLDLRVTAIPQTPPKLWRPSTPPAPAPPAPTVSPASTDWFHPLAGPRRELPLNDSRRFGATRPQPRPPECGLGHCGVDLGSTVGDPVFAVYEGIVERIERDATRDLRSGRYVRIGHLDGTVVSRYIHLDSIRDDLFEGARVRGGEMIGRLGSTGIFTTGPHLHFALSLRDGGRGTAERHLDPEPLLRIWRLPSSVEEPAHDRLASSSPAPILPAPSPAPAPSPSPSPMLAPVAMRVPSASASPSPAPVPAPAPVAMPAPPSPPSLAPRVEARWVPEHWAWNGRGWVWVPGAWRWPLPREARWIPGRWYWNGSGWIWIAGSWRVPAYR